MSSLGKTLDPYLFFELRSQTKVKVLDYHLTKPLIAYVSINNMLGIWDLDRKTCIKNFNIGALESKDLSKSVAIKAVKFYDRDILNSMFPNDPSDSESAFYLCSWLIAVAEAKIYFFDYVSEKIDVITPALLDSKLPKCVEIVDTRYIAIGCSDGFVKVFDVVLWNVSKTIKGFHHRTINHLLAYKPYDATKPRLVVSSLDGTMACWNIDSEAPLFKFNMVKSGKQILTANNLEDVTSISYNRANNQIVTITEHYITLWNSQTGDEIIRYKNIKDSHKVTLVEASFLHYGSLNKDLMIGHAKSSELMLFDVGKGLRSKDATTLDCFTIMDFKNLKDFEKNFRIYSAKTHFEKPHLVYVATSQGVFAISLMKLGTVVSVLSSPFYALYMMPSMTKPFLNEDGTVKKLDNNAIQKIQSFELVDIGNRLPNVLFLTVSNEQIYCHILDRTKLDLLPETPQGSIAKTIIGQADGVPIDEEFEVKSSLDGKYFSIRYLKSGLFSIYAITNKNVSFPRESDNVMVLDNLHPVGSIEKIYSSCAISLDWHQEKNEFAALVPVTKEGKPIEVKEKIETVSKGGFFGGKVTKRVLQANTSDIAKSVLFIFQVRSEGGAVKVQAKAKNDTFVDPKKIFGGPFYSIIDNITEGAFNELMNAELEPIKKDLRNVMTIKMSFIEFNDASQQFEKIGKPMLAAEALYWNLSSTLLVAAYRTSFFVYRYNPFEKIFKYQQTVARKILDGFFWENLFFYITETSIRVAVLDFQDEVVDIVLAEDNQEPNYLAEIYFEEYFMKDDEFIFDTIYPQPQLKPPGHIKILGVYDYKLILATSKEEFCKIDLDHPFLKICLNLQFGNGSECISELKRIDQKAWGPVFELFEIYKQFKEADALLTLLQDADVKNKCILKRSFMRDHKESLAEIELTETTPLMIQESLALDYFAHYEAAPNLDLSTIKGSENSSVLNVLCNEKALTEFAKKHPSLNFALGDRIDPEQRSLKEYFEKLLTLGN